MNTFNQNRVAGLLVLVVVIKLLATDTASGAGCYCMMESKSVGASYNKTGFEDYTTNTIRTVYLHSLEVYITGTHHWSDDGAGDTSGIDDSYKEVVEQNYDLSVITNIPGSVLHCGSYKLPYTMTLTDNDSGSMYYNSGGSGYSFDWSKVESELNGDYGTYTCSGTWHYHDTSGSSSDSMCVSDPFPYRVSNARSGDYWTQTTHTTQDYSEVINESMDAYSGGGHDDWDDDTIVLSNPFTDSMLRDQIIARLPAWPTNWSGGTGQAYYDLDGTHECGGGGKMQYRVKVPQSETNTIYTLQWQQITQFYDKTNIIIEPKTGDVIGTGDPVNPAVSDTYPVDMPQDLCYIYETAPEIIKVTQKGGGSPSTPGQGQEGNIAGTSPK